MGQTVLVTGGAGFIGSHIVDLLVEKGYTVRVLDALAPQVHGKAAERPDYLHPDAQFVRADVADRDAVRQALDGVEMVSHQAAAVGVGQSMYEVERYVRENSLATSVPLLCSRSLTPTS